MNLKSKDKGAQIMKKVKSILALGLLLAIPLVSEAWSLITLHCGANFVRTSGTYGEMQGVSNEHFRFVDGLKGPLLKDGVRYPFKRMENDWRSSGSRKSAYCVYDGLDSGMSELTMRTMSDIWNPPLEERARWTQSPNPARSQCADLSCSLYRRG